MPSEFDLIQTYFNWQQSTETVVKGVGDDGAVVRVPEGKQLVVTTDTLISGVHFPEQTSAHAIGHKSLAVNLSDLAAMGADPAWFTLAISMPEQDDQWLVDFSSGLKSLADEASIVLIGGDTTKGSLSISITAMGLADQADLLLRSAAKDGDSIYVTGQLGDAAAGLAMVQNRFSGAISESCIQRLNYPKPRNFESQLIREYATACLDISDGFLADLGHILEASKLGAHIDLDCIPLSPELQRLDRQLALDYALRGGDDYELLFTVPQKIQAEFEQFIQHIGLICYCVGTMDQSVNGIVSLKGGELKPTGYNHFTGNTP